LEIIKAIILGIVQGTTEFLPVSSSGHLVLGSKILNFQEQGVVFDVFLHLGTLLAVVLVFRKDLLEMIKAPFLMMKGSKDPEVRNYFFWNVYVIVGTIPIVFVGLLINDYIDMIFKSELVVYCMLAVTGILMFLTSFLKERGVTLNCSRSLIIGIAQAMAIMPGLSRSGSTIFAGMALGLKRETAARFAFIMSIPAIIGAVILQYSEMLHNSNSVNGLLAIGAGTVMSAVSGYFAIVLLLDIVKRNRLQWFGYYCLVISFVGFVFYFL